MTNRRAQHGFTLVELMVVVAIISILSMFAVGASTRPVGGNARNSSQLISQTIAFAKLRANATRRVQRVQFEPGRVSIFAAPNVGMVAGSGTWDLIRDIQLPSRVKIWSLATTTVTATNQTVAENTSLQASIEIRPDGQATAGTVYVTDGAERWRVLVYRITGASYARSNW